MPYGRRTFKKTFRKRPFKKSYKRPKTYVKRYTKKRTYAKIRGTVLSDYTLVKLKNTGVITLPFAGIVGGVGQHSKTFANIYGNDIYDPFRVFGTEQPVGFTQWMAMYQQFIVHKSTIKVTPVSWVDIFNGSTGDGAILPFIMCVFPSKNPITTPMAATFEPEEQPYVRKRNYNGNMLNDTVSASGVNFSSTAFQYGQSAQPGVYNSMMTKKILGYKDLSDVEEVRGTIASSPTELYYWNIAIESQIPASATNNAYSLAAMYVRVEQTFYVQFIGRQSLENAL